MSWFQDNKPVEKIDVVAEAKRICVCGHPFWEHDQMYTSHACKKTCLCESFIKDKEQQCQQH